MKYILLLLLVSCAPSSGVEEKKCTFTMLWHQYKLVCKTYYEHPSVLKDCEVIGQKLTIKTIYNATDVVEECK